MSKKKLFNEETLRKFLKKESRTVIEISEYFDVSVKDINKVITTLKKGHYNIKEDEGKAVFLQTDMTSEISKTTINPDLWDGDTIRFGFTSDNHLGNVHTRLDVLDYLYDYFAKEGIQIVYNGGNMIDGEARFNKNELIPQVHGMTNQVNYLARNFPFRPGITTEFVTGDDHEGWYAQREGIVIGDYMVQQRETAGYNDFKYLGNAEVDICLSNKDQPHKSWMKLVHAGGGTAYALSYKPQKLAESYQGGEKPCIVLIGHYHKFEYCYPREIHMIQMATTCDQTLFMRKQQIQAHVGGGTVELTRSTEGIITSAKIQWIPCYDRGFYTDKDRYHKVN